MRKGGCLFKTTSLFFFSIIKKGERTHATKTLCQTAQKDDVERRRDRGKQRVVEVVSTRRRIGRRVSRYLFPTHSSEFESNGYQILVRGESGDEKVD